MTDMNSQTEHIENKGLKENESKPFRSQLGPILFLAAIFFLNFMARIVLAPLMPAIEADLGVDHAEAGSFFLLLSVGYFVSVLFSGLLSSRMTHRKVITISAMAVGASLSNAVLPATGAVPGRGAISGRPPYHRPRFLQRSP